MNDHYWLINILRDGKYSAMELVVGARLIKKSETDLQFMTVIGSPLGASEPLVFDTADKVREFTENLRIPYCFTKKAFERYTS